MTEVSKEPALDEDRLSNDEVGLVADRMWDELVARLPESGLTRIRGLLDVLARRVEPQLHPKQGTQGRWYMPDLPSSAWLDRAAFEPLASSLEQLYPELRRELLAEESQGAFRPYGYAADAPEVRQDWVPAGWDELRLWQDLQPTTSVLRMPVAARALRAIVETTPLVNHVAFLSMKPGTQLPVHCDRTNWYVSIHLGIDVPPGCALRVADEERRWEDGKCCFFDNSFAHEAWNRGDARRVVFAVYLAHPLTTEVERQALRHLHIRYQSLAPLGNEATLAWARNGRRLEGSSQPLSPGRPAMNEQAPGIGGEAVCPPLLPQDGLPMRPLTDAERPYACGDSSLPVVIEPSRSRDVQSLARRVADHSHAITATLAGHGAILFRGFDVRGDADFETLVTSIDAARPMAGYFMCEPGRHRVENTRGVFKTNTLYKTGGALYLGGLHSENFYSTDVPSLQAFWCKASPRLGGETAFVHAAKLYAALPPDLQQRLAGDRVLAREFSIRDIAARYGVSAGAVEELCRELGLEVRDDGEAGRRLVLYKPTLIRHPTTGRLAVQFNVSGEVPGFDAAFRRYAAPSYRGWPWSLHRAIWRWPALTSLAPALDSYPMFRQALSGLLEQLKGRLRPRPAPEPEIRRGRVAERLTDDDVEALAQAAWRNLSIFTWRTGDVLVFDQLQVLHVGMPGRGHRELHVIMCDPIRMDWPLASGVLEPTRGDQPYESLGSRLEALAKAGNSDC